MQKSKSPLFYLLSIAMIAIAGCTFQSSFKNAQPFELSSSKFLLELKTTPFSFSLKRRSSGEVLVRSSATHVITKEGKDIILSNPYSIVTKKRGASLQYGQGAQHTATTVEIAMQDSDLVQITINSPQAAEIQHELIDAGEQYYGVWEHALSQGLGNRGIRHSYGPIENRILNSAENARTPFFFTSKFYGIYLPTDATGEFSFATNHQTYFSIKASTLTSYLFAGDNYKELLQIHQRLSGAARMPPLWALGGLWWRDDQWNSLHPGAKNGQENLLRDADLLNQNNIRASALWIDRPYGTGEQGWGNMDFSDQFPNPADMIEQLSNRGYKLMLWIANRAAGKLWREGHVNNYLFPAENDKDWPAADIRKPEVNTWLSNNLAQLASIGISGFKIDRGDDGGMPADVVNEIATQLPKLAAEALERNGMRDYFLLARNLHDKGREYSAVWNGDPKASWDGLRDTLKAGLRSGFLNFPVWGSDGGGYSGLPSRELFSRWIAFAAFSPIMEVLIDHADKVFWYDFGTDIIAEASYFSNLRYNLLPYIRSELADSIRSGTPMLRALFIEYPNDPKLLELWDQYLFGKSLLVAPVFAEGARSRAVYLPEGQWCEYPDCRVVLAGQTTIQVAAPLMKMPLFMRRGTAIARGEILAGNAQDLESWNPSNLRLEIFPPASGVMSYDYFDGTLWHLIRVETYNNEVQVLLPPELAGSVIKLLGDKRKLAIRLAQS